jgi:hypothetical protein
MIGRPVAIAYVAVALFSLVLLIVIQCNPCLFFADLQADGAKCPEPSAQISLLAIPAFLLIAAVGLGLKGLAFWTTRLAFLLLASVLLFALFSAPPLKLRNTGYSDARKPFVTTVLPNSGPDRALQLILDEHKKAVDQIKMHIEQ